MSELTYEAKKDFVDHAMSRCIAAMYPQVCRTEYRVRVDIGEPEEWVVLRLAGGYSRRVDVTAMDLRETMDAVLAAFGEAV